MFDSGNVDDCSPVAVDSKEGRCGRAHWTRSWRCRTRTPATVSRTGRRCLQGVRQARVPRSKKPGVGWDRSIEATRGAQVIEVESRGLNYASVTARDIANDEDGVFLLGLQLEGRGHRDPGRPRKQYFNRATSLCSTRSGPITSHYSPKWRRLFIKIPHRCVEGEAGADLAAHGARGAARERSGRHPLRLRAPASSSHRQPAGDREGTHWRATPRPDCSRSVGATWQRRGAVPVLGPRRGSLAIADRDRGAAPDPSLDPEAAAGAAGISVAIQTRFSPTRECRCSA